MESRNKLLGYARRNRSTATKSEQMMWNVLRKKQFSSLKFRRQHVIEPYIVDFACLSAKTIVEIDGGYHELTETADQERQRYLESLGWRFLRFTSEDVESNLETILAIIAKHLAVELEIDRRTYRPSGMMKKSNCRLQDSAEGPGITSFE